MIKTHLKRLILQDVVLGYSFQLPLTYKWLERCKSQVRVQLKMEREVNR